MLETLVRCVNSPFQNERNACAGSCVPGVWQTSRGSWRIGQTRPVRVVFMAYRNSLQADALKLVAKKLQSSLAVEGELPEDGLAAYGDDGDDLMLALARKIVNGDEDEAETVESVFAQARDAEATAEEYLVDDGWKAVEIETDSVAVDVNGHDDIIGIGPTVDPVLGSDHDETGEPQQSLFSWTEFLAGEQGVRRRRKPKPASASLFEWAFGIEQERAKEPVGAGR